MCMIAASSLFALHCMCALFAVQVTGHCALSVGEISFDDPGMIPVSHAICGPRKNDARRAYWHVSAVFRNLLAPWLSSQMTQFWHGLISMQAQTPIQPQRRYML